MHFLLLCAVCLAVSFLAGHHQPPIQAAILLGMYALYLKVSKQYARDHVPFLVGLIVIAFMAALLAAIQIFPSAEWGSLAYRWAGSYGPLQGGEKIPHYVLENVEKVHPQDFLSILFPYATTMVNLYVGPMVVVLAFLGAMFSQKRESKFFLIAAILFTLFSLGKYSILHTWLYTYVPGMWFAREGIYFLLPFLICIALLAGYGLDALSEKSTNPADVSIQKIAGSVAKLLVIVLAILIAICIGAVLQDEHFLKDSRISKAAGLMLYLILICILFGFVYFKKISAPVFQTLIVAMIVIDLGSEISRAIPLKVSDEGEAFTPANVYQKNEIAKTVKDYQFHERFRVDDLSDILPPNAGDAWLIYSTRGYTTTMDQHYYDLRASGWGQFSNPSALLNTRYFISPVVLDFADSIWNQDETGIYRNPRAVPEVFSVTQAKIFSDKEELLKFMNSPLFNPHSTGLFLKEDWRRLPNDWQKKIASPTIDLDLARLDYVKAEDKGLDHPNPEIRHLYSKPWGWDSGDAMNGFFRLAAETDVNVLLNYFASETDCSLAFVLKNSKQIKNEQVELKADANKSLTRTELRLGKLNSDNYQFQLEIPQNCSSRLDSLEFVTAISESSNVAEVKILSHEPHSITVSTSSKKPSLLLLSEVSYPGWIAKLDGGEIPIYRVNYAFRAVTVDAGKHKIEFHFRPASIYAGFAVTFISLAGVLIYLWLQRKHLLSQ